VLGPESFCQVFNVYHVVLFRIGEKSAFD